MPNLLRIIERIVKLNQQERKYSKIPFLKESKSEMPLIKEYLHNNNNKVYKEINKPFITNNLINKDK